jgi:large subunit ribosomal protein L24
MIKLKIKKGDNVKVITGDDKGKTGSVIKVFPDIRKVLVKRKNIKNQLEKKRVGLLLLKDQLTYQMLLNCLMQK